MAIQQGLTTSFKVELLTATHNFTASTGDTFKIALYTSSATLGPATTVYTTSNEVPSTGGYTAGGNTLTNITPTSSGTTALTDFADTTWSGVTLTARGALIYNSSKSNKSVAVLDFGSDKSTTSGDLTIVFPPATATEAIIRIA
jgi:hypothetical protein